VTCAPLPEIFRIEFGGQIFLPSNLATFPITAKNSVQVALLGDLASSAPGLNGLRLRLTDLAIPTTGSAPTLNRRESFVAEGCLEIFQSVFVEVCDQVSVLLH
jgi:hypothetical protein